MLLENSTAAYIVRVWVERREVEDAPVAWRGSIEQVTSGKIKYVTDLDEIARFIRPFLESMGVGITEQQSDEENDSTETVKRSFA